MKKIKIMLLLAASISLFMTGCKHKIEEDPGSEPSSVTNQENTSENVKEETPDEDTEEDGYLDLRNVLVESSENRSVSGARVVLAEDFWSVNQPCTAADFTGDDLLRFNEWNTVNQNAQIYTDELISKMFKFEPFVSIDTVERKIEKGIKVTYTRPENAPYSLMYWIQIVLFDKNGNMVVSQEIDDIFDHSEGYEWFFPYVDPIRGPDIIGLQFNAEGKQVNKMYKVGLCLSGLGKPKDLPSYDEQKSHLEIDTSAKKYILKDIKLPDEKNLIVHHQLIAMAEKQIDYDGKTIKRYPADENGRSLVKVFAEVKQSISDTDKKNKTTFELNYKDLDGYADKTEYPYWYIRTDFKYENDDFPGTYHGVTLVSDIYDNDYFSIPTHERLNCSLKDAYYAEVNNAYGTFDFSALKGSDKYISFEIETKVDNAEAVVISVNNNAPWIPVNSYKGKQEYCFKISDMVAIQDNAEAVDPTKDHTYVVNFYPLIKNGEYEMVDIKLCSEPKVYPTATVTLRKNQTVINTVECKVGINIRGSLPVPDLDDGFFGGWYTDSECTQAFSGVITGDTVLYAKTSEILDLSTAVEKLSVYGNIHLDYTKYLPDNADKYVCFTITKSQFINSWAGVSVDNHYDGYGFKEFWGEATGTYKYAIKISDIKAKEDAVLEATGGTWGQDPHWNSKYLVFGQFLAEDSVYTLDEIYLSASVPEGFTNLN